MELEVAATGGRWWKGTTYPEQSTSTVNPLLLMNVKKPVLPFNASYLAGRGISLGTRKRKPCLKKTGLTGSLSALLMPC